MALWKTLSMAFVWRCHNREATASTSPLCPQTLYLCKEKIGAMFRYLCLTSKKIQVQASKQEKIAENLFVMERLSLQCCPKQENIVLPVMWLPSEWGDGGTLAMLLFLQKHLVHWRWFGFPLFLASSLFSLADQAGKCLQCIHSLPKNGTEFQYMRFVPAGWSHTCGLQIEKLCLNQEFKCHFFSSWLGTKMQNFKALKKNGCLANIYFWRHPIILHNYLTINAETKLSVLKASSEYFVI